MTPSRQHFVRRALAAERLRTRRISFNDPFGLTPALLLRLGTWIASNWRAITTAIGIGRTAGRAAQNPAGQEAIGAAAGPAVSAADAIGRGLVSTGGHLARLLPAIEAQAAKLNPSSAMDALGVISQATRSVGLEPGMITQLANGSIQIVSRGGITTSLGSSGSILIERGKDVLLNIPK